MKKSRWLLYVLCLPWTLTVSYPLIGLFCLLGMAESVRWDNFGVLTAVWTEKVARKWEYSTTFGRAVVFYPGMRDDVRGLSTRVEKHEDVHVRQMEDNAALGFLLFILLATFGHWGLGLFVWWSSGVWLAVCYLTSGVRWGWSPDSIYRNAEHERSAYAQTDVFKRSTPVSWEEAQ